MTEPYGSSGAGPGRRLRFGSSGVGPDEPAAYRSGLEELPGRLRVTGPVPDR